MDHKFGDARIFGVRRKVFYPLLVGAIVVLAGILLLVNSNKPESKSPQGGQQAITQFEEDESTSVDPLRPGDPAPEIPLAPVAGKGPVSFEGEPTLVEFVATWCPHCQKMAPVIDRALEKVPTNFIMVGAAGEPDAKVSDFHQNFLEKPMPGVAANDPEESVTDAYDVASYPTMSFIDSDGTIVALVAGERPESDIVKLLKEIRQ